MSTSAAAIPPTPSPTDPSAGSVLSATGLVKDFGPLRAVNGVDLTLEAGAFLTVFGPNGAGKTTLLGLLGGRLRPTAGEVRLGGEPLDSGTTGWRSRIGVLSHQGMLYGHLTARENLLFFGRLYGLPDLGARVPARLEQVGLAERADDFVRQLSHGMRQRLALARALLHDPELVLLDEPYTGLDPYAATVLRDVLASLRDGRRTVVMVTHNLREGLELSDRLAIQVRGSLAWQGLRTEVEAGAFEVRYHQVVEGGAGVSTYLRQIYAIVWKDLLLEARTRERLVAMGGFAILAGVLFHYSFDRTRVRPQDIAAGLVWMTLVFGGLLGIGRTFYLEAQDAAFQGVLMSPAPKDAVFLGKTLANFLLLFVVALLVLVVFALFFQLDLGPHPGVLVAALGLGCLGFVALGTLFSAVSTDTRMGETLLPILVFPLLVPMVVFGVSATTRLLGGRPVAEVAGNLRMLGAFALLAVAAGAGLFRFVVEE